MPADDFDTRFDMETLLRAQEIERDSARLARIRNFAERQSQEMRKVADSIPGRPKKAFNGGVKASRMAR